MRNRFLLLAGLAWAAAAGLAQADDTPRIAVISAFEPEWQILKAKVEGADETVINGNRFVTGTLEGKPVVLFLSGVSMVNAAMNTQLALDRFQISALVFSGIAGGVDPELEVGDVVVAENWGQYLDSIFARETLDGYAIPPFLSSDFPNFDMMFPRNQEVTSARQPDVETRFWFPVDAALLDTARKVAAELTLNGCDTTGACLRKVPKIVVGGNGVSGAAFVDNADFRAYAYQTFDARVLDMESAAVAHVAYVNQVPFIAFRSLSDLAGGGDDGNELPIFFQLAADNAAGVVTSFLKALP